MRNKLVNISLLFLSKAALTVSCFSNIKLNKLKSKIKKNNNKNSIKLHNTYINLFDIHPLQTKSISLLIKDKNSFTTINNIVNNSKGKF
jgi:hypothetical protein